MKITCAESVCSSDLNDQLGCEKKEPLAVKDRSSEKFSLKAMIQPIRLDNKGEAPFIPLAEASALVGISSETLRKIPLPGCVRVRYGHRTVRYNRELLIVWAATRNNPQAFDRAVTNYLDAIGANAPARRGRPRKT